jgi:Zn-finger nucleic acid-binding protein
MDCPVCHKPLVVVEREGIELDWCLSCRGLWFDEGELELLAEKSGRRLEAEDLGDARPKTTPPVRRKCPRCRRKLLHVLAGSVLPVEVDRCDAHGFWLDRGELGKIMRQLPSGQDSDAAVILHFLGETFAAEDA